MRLNIQGIRWRCVALLFVCLLSAISVRALTWERTSGELVMEEGVESAVIEYAFKNEGTAPVSIRDVKSNCGCATPTVGAKLVPAGGRGVVKVSYSPGKRVGLQNVKIELKTDEGPSPNVLLVLRVDIRPWITMTPRLVHWRKADGLVSRTVEINRTGKSELSIDEVKAPGGHIDVKLVAGDQPDTWRLTITPKEVDSPFTEKVEIGVVTKDGRKASYNLFAVAH